MNMKRNVMLIVAMCMVSAVAFAQKTIRVSTDKTDLVLKVSPKGKRVRDATLLSIFQFFTF
uniref:hypothetical protein n=1 Tax=Prevotella sp. TaxID=59823 RepID=UPI003FF02632